MALARYYKQMPNAILVATTEMNSPDELNQFHEALKAILAESLKVPKSAACDSLVASATGSHQTGKPSPGAR